jgi:hypothetical protein
MAHAAITPGRQRDKQLRRAEAIPQPRLCIGEFDGRSALARPFCCPRLVSRLTVAADGGRREVNYPTRNRAQDHRRRRKMMAGWRTKRPRSVALVGSTDLPCDQPTSASRGDSAAFALYAVDDGACLRALRLALTLGPAQPGPGGHSSPHPATRIYPAPRPALRQQ